MLSRFAPIHMATAQNWAMFGTCQRLRVGAVLALDERIVATGFNGAASGLPHCRHEDPFNVEDRCHNAVHAEANVIAFAANYGRSNDCTTLYITAAPCYSCSGLLISAGISAVVFDQHYRSTEGIDQLSAAGIDCERYVNDH